MDTNEQGKCLRRGELVVGQTHTCVYAHTENFTEGQTYAVVSDRRGRPALQSNDGSTFLGTASRFVKVSDELIPKPLPELWGSVSDDVKEFLCVHTTSSFFTKGSVYRREGEALLDNSGVMIEHTSSTFVPVLDQSNEGGLATPPTKGLNPKALVGNLKPGMGFVPPVAIFATNQAFEDGAVKYGPFNWRDTGVEAMTYYNAAQRHLMSWFEGEDRASDSGCLHLAHAIACLAILIDADANETLDDNRPLKGCLPKWLEDNKKK